MFLMRGYRHAHPTGGNRADRRISYAGQAEIPSRIVTCPELGQLSAHLAAAGAIKGIAEGFI
jgi:hypothetical protein